MTALLTILILLGITIAIWQMVKIFDLTQTNLVNYPIITGRNGRKIIENPKTCW